MLARISGGNDGVVDYLVNGIKNGRDFTREELDHRVILDGDLNVTDQVINSISNNGQERYLHITLSFHENEVSQDLLQKVTEDYKNLLMASHEVDEYSFYAEAHIPKIKQIEDQKTGEMIERKPHIHIVIPNKNLLTGKNLNAVGLVQSNIKELDAIQEHINLKYGLESPKNHLRVQGGDRARVISREKADIYKERNGELKAEIFTNLENKNIDNVKDFESLLTKYGEVRIYNQGKENSYYGVKPEGHNKFIRLKSKVFTKEYIEKRSIAEPVKSVKEINKLVSNWQNVTSKEIKYINPSGKARRVAYALMDRTAKENYIKEVEDNYYEQHTDSIGYIRREGRPNRKSSLAKHVKERGFTSSTSFQRLSQLRNGSLVHSIRGGGRIKSGESRSQSKPVLPLNEGNSLAETRERGSEYNHREVRSISKRRIDNVKPLMSPIAQELKEEGYKLTGEELKTINHIKENIDPDRFISHCCIQYFMNPEHHKISKGRDGSPRFSNKNRNWNALDFLTKVVNLKLDEAVETLKEINEKQVSNKPFVRIDTQSFLNKEDRLKKNKSLKSKNSLLKTLYRNELKESNQNFYDLIDDVFKDHKNSYEEKRVLKDFYKALKLNRSAIIDKKFKDSVVELRESFFNYNPFKEKEIEMKFEKIMNRFKSEENEITGHQPCLTFDEVMKKNRRDMDLQELVSTKKILGLADLAVVKDLKKEKIDFVDPDTRTVLFTDQGDRVTYKGKEDADATLAMLKYAHEKFGGQLKLKGSKEFKMACVEALAKSDMKVVLLPKEYHDLLIEKKALNVNKEAPKQEKSLFEKQIDELKQLDSKVKLADQDNILQASENRDAYVADLALSLVKEEELRTGEPITKEMINTKVKFVADELGKDFKKDLQNWDINGGKQRPNPNDYSILTKDTLETVASKVADDAQKEQEKIDLSELDNHKDIISTRTRSDLQSQGVEIDEIQLSKLTNESIHKYSKFIEKDEFKIDRQKGVMNIGKKEIKYPQNLVTNKGIINHVAYDFVRDDINAQMNNKNFAQVNIDNNQKKDIGNDVPEWVNNPNDHGFRHDLDGDLDDDLDR